MRCIVFGVAHAKHEPGARSAAFRCGGCALHSHALRLTQPNRRAVHAARPSRKRHAGVAGPYTIRIRFLVILLSYACHRGGGTCRLEPQARAASGKGEWFVALNPYRICTHTRVRAQGRTASGRRRRLGLRCRLGLMKRRRSLKGAACCAVPPDLLAFAC